MGASLGASLGAWVPAWVLGCQLGYTHTPSFSFARVTSVRGRTHTGMGVRTRAWAYAHGHATWTAHGPVTANGGGAWRAQFIGSAELVQVGEAVKALTQKIADDDDDDDGGGDDDDGDE